MAATKHTKPFYNTEIPSDWEVVELGSIAKIKHGRDQKQIEVENGIYPILATGGEIGRTNTPLYSKPSVLIGRKGTIDKPKFMNTPFWTVDTLFYTEISERVIPLWLYFKFETINWYLYNEASGVPSLSGSTISKVKIPLPPLPEQKAIAQVLSTADAAIHTTEKLIAQKELRKKWLMQNLLTGKKRLKGFGGEWKEMHLGDMFTERNETKYYDLPLLSIGQNGVYPQDESIKKDTSNEDKSKYKRICPGDIGYNTMRMWQGRSALSELEGIVSPAYTVVTPKKNADSIFFSYLFKMPKMTNLFWRNSQGLVDDTLNCKFKDFSIVKTMLPTTKEEQTAIAQVLQAADKEISLLKAKAEKLREQKKGLMQVLLTGKKRLLF